MIACFARSPAEQVFVFVFQVRAFVPAGFPPGSKSPQKIGSRGGGNAAGVVQLEHRAFVAGHAMIGLYSHGTFDENLIIRIGSGSE